MYTKRIRCALLIAGMVAPANAQGNRGTYYVQCRLFKRLTDGTWLLTKANE